MSDLLVNPTGGQEAAPLSVPKQETAVNTAADLSEDGVYYGVSEAPTIIIKDEYIKKLFEKCVGMYKSMFPDEYQRFCKEQEKIRESAYDPRVFTRNRTMLHFADIPRRLHNIVAYHLGNDWIMHWQLWVPFLEVFNEARINEKSVMKRE